MAESLSGRVEGRQGGPHSLAAHRGQGHSSAHGEGAGSEGMASRFFPGRLLQTLVPHRSLDTVGPRRHLAALGGLGVVGYGRTTNLVLGNPSSGCPGEGGYPQSWPEATGLKQNWSPGAWVGCSLSPGRYFSQTDSTCRRLYPSAPFTHSKPHWTAGGTEALA